MSDKYTALRNPMNFVFPWEVWYSGISPVQNAQGFLENRHVTRRVKSFRTEDKANDTIQYYEKLEGIRGENNAA
ncbi:MAG: hypothetical protein KGI54_16380 [Pseudomonadota bacterium]|nr:hypothetical protein [Pseudomonadota bacterium]